jgi:eukaryotic-like serine/threonine-protein kinase
MLRRPHLIARARECEAGRLDRHNGRVSSGERVVAGRYRLRRRLGQGAMGTVWEAFDEFLRRPVAVKEVLLPPGMPDDQAAELRERTLREARAIAALSHPNVVTLHDVARMDGEPFVVMEYMLAHSLAVYIDVLGPLPEAKVAAIADAVAAGLAAAHHVGITHRDVKPGNVLIGADGRVKLTDFGIARNVAERTLTSTGIMLGSPAYIAPEVAAGREVTPAADLWGLGATLFAAIEGRPPYDVNGTVLATVNQVVNGEVPRTSRGGSLGEVVAALMVKEPAERVTLQEVRGRVHHLLPPPHTPLFSEEELARVDAAVGAAAHAHGAEVTDDAPDLTEDEREPAPLSTDPGSLPSGPGAPLAADPGSLPPGLAAALGTAPPSGAGSSGPALAQTPGPLPFDAPVQPKVRRGRGAVVTGTVALARYVGGKPLLPPSARPVSSQTNETTEETTEELVPRTGSAETAEGDQSGGFSIPVPESWQHFVELVHDTDFANSTRAYYLSQNGTQVLTVERLANYYMGHDIREYVARLRSSRGTEVVYERQIADLANVPVAPKEPALEVSYRTTVPAHDVAPDDPAAHDLSRATFAHLIPYANDLWVVSVTVPIEQQDSGETLFNRIAGGFQVTG